MSEKHAFGWNCRACSYYHRYPAPRCTMCDQPRISKQDMVNFVQGKPIPPLTNGNVVELLSSQESNDGKKRAAAMRKETTANPQTIGGQATTIAAPNGKENNAQAPPAAALPSRNPYAKPSSGTTVSGQSKLPPQGQQQHNNAIGNGSDPPQHHYQTHPRPAASLNHPQHQHQQQNSGSASTSNFQQQQRPQQQPPPAASATRPQHQQGQQQSIPAQQKQKHPFFDEKKRRQMLEQPKDRRTFEPGPVPLNAVLSKTYLYPQNDAYPLRQYQAEMAETALNCNTLVSLPTGLGKTHIAAVVMYNFYRWFAPVGKIIFLAPTLPLVSQQVNACYRIVGIPGEDTAVMTGKINSERRRQLWQEKRVFYCTPQTVQKDLQTIMEEANNSGESSLAEFASQVVCLVLDEAHKATGEYAYTKVIELLENAGAKFRVVGLSATPGTSISAVQGVIDALRTVKLAAKTDRDESVAQYLHQKVAEIVVCERSSHSRDVERLFSELIGPLLERLREDGGLRHTGNATLTAWPILQALQNYQKCFGARQDGALVSCFHAAHKLVSIRSECHQSLATVKIKMLRLKNEPQRGILSSIVKGPEFDAIFQKVVQATGGDEEGAATVKDPKLAKLCSILKHHFVLAQEKGRDSRAIVFAQFRDSVGEIVDTLQKIGPGIRARHFVGQGNSKSKKKEGKHQVDDRLKGMKQPEQQKVIKKFKEDVYNVLVCTSIGEEGLDIGEVDLIVNYDVISSPIRTIQRAGRTGRKRDGRVICLVSEGKEEQTYRKRLESERTLTNALKNPKRFTMHPHRPMFPSVPNREFQKMDIQSQLHMSQVEGAHKTPVTGKRAPSKGRSNDSAWKLDEDEETERSQLCRDPLVLDKDISWNALTKYFLKCRVEPSQMSPEKQRRREKILKTRRERPLGRNWGILNGLEGPTNTNGSTRRGYDKFKAVFPVEPVKEDKLFSLSDEPPSMPDVKRTLWHEVESNCGEETQNGDNRTDENLAEINTEQEVAAVTDTSVHRKVENHDRVSPNGAAASIFPPAVDPSIETESNPPPDHHNMPDQHQNSAANDNAVVGAEAANGQAGSLAEQPPAGFVNADHQAQQLRDAFRLPTPPPSSSSSDEDSKDDDSVDEAIRQLPFGSNCGAQIDTVVNPVVAAGPSEASHDDVDVGAATAKPLRIKEENLPTESIQEEDDEEDVMLSSLIKKPNKKKTPPKAAEKDVMLSSLKKKKKRSASKRKSGSKKKSSSAETSDDDVMLISSTKKRKITSSSAKKTSRPKATNNNASDGATRNDQSPTNHCAPDSKRDASSIERAATQNGSQEVKGDFVSGRSYKRPHIGSPESDIEHGLSMKGMSASATQDNLARQTPSQNESGSPNALQDTPEPKAQSNMPKKRCSGDFLTDTPLDDEDDVQEEIVCQVCRFADSADGDMIVLCDACDAGYHQRCYSIPDGVVKNADTTWFCDKCRHRSGSPLSVFNGSCVYCCKSDGAMRHKDISWCHCLCSMFESKMCASTCSSCSRGRAVKCEECSEAKHPFCAKAANWTLVVPKSSGSDPRMYCPQHVNGVEETVDVRVISNAKLKRGSSDGRPKKIQRKALQQETEFDPEDASDEDEEKRERLQRRRDVLARFALDEADASDDMDGDAAEEAEARRIEEEEGLSQDSFINDNAHLTQHFSQDELGEVDPDAADGEIDYSHRALDAQREMQNQFSTPFFNRRMRGEGDGSQTVPSSQRGLGDMRFIRSVLEHHRQGGDAEDIERMYNHLEQQGSASPAASAGGDWASQSQNPVTSNATAENQASSNNVGGSTLTAEQLARIEANRQEALRRRARSHQNGAQN